MSIDKIKNRIKMIEQNCFVTSGETNEIILTAAALAAKAMLANKAVKTIRGKAPNNTGK